MNLPETDFDRERQWDAKASKEEIDSVDKSESR